MSIVFGLFLLLIGGDILVRGAVTIARKIGISELMIGLTLVGFGTSTPELVTSVKAAFSGSPGIAVGNVVGSNIANILVILGLAALINPITCQPSAIRRDGSALMLSTLCCLALALYGKLTLFAGVIFILLLLSYVVYTYFKERASNLPSAELHRSETQLAEPVMGNLWTGILMALFGIAFCIYGAQLLVEGAIMLAKAQGISESKIGLTIVAVGTSLPEMVISLVAAFRRNGALALGNVIGSNIYNAWFILGLTAVIHPIKVPESIIAVDIWVMLVVSLLLMVIIWKWQRISRGSGLAFILLYSAYVAFMVNGVQ